MTGERPEQVYLVRPAFAERLTPGIRLRVELEQRVGRDAAPRVHRVGRATVRDGGELALKITTASEAGRVAAALLDDDILDVKLWGNRPVVRLR